MRGRPGHFVAHYPTLGRWFETSVYPVPEGIALITRDVSATKELEVRRAELIAELEATNHVKDDFLATLSHELRTPLNAVLGWTQMLETPVGPPDRAIRAIGRNGMALKQLVDDLLDHARVVSGKLHMDVEAVDLARVTTDAIETSRATTRGPVAPVALSVSAAPVRVMADATRLQQVVLNLISNAVKFTPADGRIEVEVAATGTTALLVVRDTGIGIEPEVLPHIFDRFVQADASITAGRRGLGLGLTIARHVVEAHGGTIHGESAGRKQGATFTVSLPLAPPATANTPERTVSRLET
jgi:signal transduction histidine kinase